MSPRSALSDRSGVSLIEIMIALSILTTVLVALGGLMFQVAHHTRQSEAVGYASAAATSAFAWAETLPWDSLSSAVGCVDDSVGQFTYARCTTVQSVTARLKRLTVVISPTGVLTPQPDTVVVERHRPVPASTLNIQ